VTDGGLTSAVRRRTLPTDGPVSVGQASNEVHVNRQASASAKSSCIRRLGCAVALLVICFLLGMGSLALLGSLVRIDPAVLSGDFASRRERIEALFTVVVADAGEDPHFRPRQPDGALPVCGDVPREYGHALRIAFGLMRGTEDGRRLYALLVDHDICVGVADLPYNAAYASARRIGGDWSSSAIVVDRAYIRAVYADVLAAILIHEATHLDRAIAGTACWEQRAPGGGDACTTLSNGVRLEEELAAHTAEAAWWRAAYGDDGKRFAWGPDDAENELLAVYLRGADVFRAYVADRRSDPHEGEGI
jgi:hypothetical protein